MRKCSKTKQLWQKVNLREAPDHNRGPELLLSKEYSPEIPVGKLHL
jgi:hypothetical protein